MTPSKVRYSVNDDCWSGFIIASELDQDKMQLEQLRELMLAKPVQKSRERKISLEELRKLGWLGGDHDDTTELVPSHQRAIGDLIIPDY